MVAIKRCQRGFFQHKSTLSLAQALLGKVLVKRFSHGKTVASIITETEAYTEDDEACHAFAGKCTKRNQAMFLAAGHVYVYLIYGMYYCLNIVAEKQGRGCAVLIRALIPFTHIEIVQAQRKASSKLSANKLMNGPGKLCQGIAIDISHNEQCLWDKKSTLWLEDHAISAPILTSQRIGISKATKHQWRFMLDYSQLKLPYS